MSRPEGMDRSGKVLIAICLICILFSAYFLLNDDILFRGNIFTQENSIGTIQTRGSDIRHRSKDSIAWFKAQDNQSIALGDAVFVGEGSTALLEMKKGGNITVNENSMVSFNQVDQDKVANLERGTFRLKLNGTVKVAVQGKMTILEGKDSEVQFEMGAGHKAQLRLLRGKAKVTRDEEKPFSLEDARSVANLGEPQEVKNSEPALPLDIPQFLSKRQKFTYVWQLGDIYDQAGFQLLERFDRPQIVPVKVKLSWSQTSPKRAFVEIGNGRDFQVSTKFDSSNNSLTVSPVHIGENFWHVSYDEKNWSPNEVFVVEAGFLPNTRPTAVATNHEIPLIGDKATETVVLTAPVDTAGFVAEAALDERFAKGETHTFWTTNSKLKLSFYKIGKYFYRFRSANMQMELSDWSEPQSFSVYEPQAPPAPLLSLATREGFVGDRFVFKYRSKSPTNEIQIRNSRHQVVYKIDSAEGTWVPDIAGHYQATAIARGTHNQHSRLSKLVKIWVKEVPRPRLAKKTPVKAEEKKREPATVESEIKTKVETTSTTYANERYKSSQLSVEGFLWTMQSTQQILAAEQAPIVAGLGLRGLHWWNHSGVEGAYKAAAIGANPTGKQNSIADIEARYHFRFYTPFPFNFARELEIALVAGYEMYRNTGSLFSSQYDLVNFGTSLEFPVAEHWSTGGEFVYGQGTDASQKIEITGHFKYFFEKTWSLGFGYRLRLFQAGSADAAPNGLLPYREGSTEGFSTLDYRF